MKILVTGADGQLGKSLRKEVFNEKDLRELEFTFAGKSVLNLNDNNQIKNFFNKNNYNLVVNCAAYTYVDLAEENKKDANQINHNAVKCLAEICFQKKMTLIHISTDYVFDGNKNNPYIETDTTNPINFYGKTKLDGEKAIQKIMPKNGIIIRTSWLYSEFGNNFVNTMLKLGKQKDEVQVVSDQIGSPTYASDLAMALIKIINKNKTFEDGFLTSLYHFSNIGEVSWYEFAKEIYKIKKYTCQVNPINSNEYPTKANRPTNTSLNISTIKEQFDIKDLFWKDSLTRHLNNLN
tara:strand:- start:785 stop:1663 length:879 start_codon:yes stop_codon:yes gene_type:complete